MRRFYILIIVCSLLVALGLGVAGGALYLRFQSSSETREKQVGFNRKICLAVDKLDVALIGIVGRSASPLQPKQYGYDYWVHHANEPLGRPGSPTTRGAIGQALVDLQNAACDKRNLTKGTP